MTRCHRRTTMNNLFWAFYTWCSGQSDKIKRVVLDSLETIRFRFMKPQIKEIVVSNVVHHKNPVSNSFVFRYISIQIWGYARLYVNKTKVTIRGEQTVVLKIPVHTPISIRITNIVGTFYASSQHIHPMLSKLVQQEGKYLIFSDENVFCDEITALPVNSLEVQFEYLLNHNPSSTYARFDRILNQENQKNIPKQSLDYFLEMHQNLTQELTSIKIPYSIFHQHFNNQMREDKL